MRRDNKDIWDLVGYDPVCTELARLHQVIAREYPHFLGLAVGKVAQMLREETYDRLSKGECNGLHCVPGEPDRSQSVPGCV